MKTVLLIGHLLCAGLWLGCVLTEALFERALLGKGRDAERTLAALHWRVDVWVEVPAFTAVVLTGGLLWGLSPHTGLLYLKAGAAGVAVLANVWCVWLVFRRWQHAQRDEWPQFEVTDHLQHKVGAVVLLGVLAAAALGVALANPWQAGLGGSGQQALVGGTWTNESQVSLLLEAWHDGTAPSSGQWRQWMARNQVLPAWTACSPPASPGRATA